MCKQIKVWVCHVLPDTSKETTSFSLVSFYETVGFCMCVIVCGPTLLCWHHSPHIVWYPSSPVVIRLPYINFLCVSHGWVWSDYIYVFFEPIKSDHFGFDWSGLFPISLLGLFPIDTLWIVFISFGQCFSGFPLLPHLEGNLRSNQG